MQTYLLYSFSLLTIQNLPLFVFNLVTTQESQYASTTTSTSHMVSQLSELHLLINVMDS